MGVFEKEGLSMSKTVISEIYLGIYVIYIITTKYKTLPLVLDLCTYLQSYRLDRCYKHRGGRA